jgi:hypothetical protein
VKFCAENATEGHVNIVLSNFTVMDLKDGSVNTDMWLAGLEGGRNTNDYFSNIPVTVAEWSEA